MLWARARLALGLCSVPLPARARLADLASRVLLLYASRGPTGSGLGSDGAAAGARRTRITTCINHIIKANRHVRHLYNMRVAPTRSKHIVYLYTVLHVTLSTLGPARQGACACNSHQSMASVSINVVA